MGFQITGMTSFKTTIHQCPRKTSIPCYSSTMAITIPKRYQHDKSPIHHNPYPSPLHTIYIAALLSQNEADECLRLAKEYAQATGCWSVKDSSRHLSYSTVDFATENCDILQSYLNQIDFERKTFQVISELFDIDVEDLSFLDLFCAKYAGKSSNTDGVMDRLNSHRDGSLISFTIVLSSPFDYEGGGTEFDALRDIGDNLSGLEDVLYDGVIKVRASGEGVIHCGKIKHGVHTVTNGERITLTGFVDVDDRSVRRGVINNACRDWGRMDNAKRRLARQNRMTSCKDIPDENYVSLKGWKISSPKYLGGERKTGRCRVEGFIPAFSSVHHRANADLQRLKNLETEDILLRDILLPRKERMGSQSHFMQMSEVANLPMIDGISIL